MLRVDDGRELVAIASMGASCSTSTTGPDDGRELPRADGSPTLREQMLCPWGQLRALAVMLRPILAPAIDRVADWPLPPGIVPTPELVIACALYYLTHAPIRALRSAKWRRSHA